jgi:hypothetical protein
MSFGATSDAEALAAFDEYLNSEGNEGTEPETLTQETPEIEAKSPESEEEPEQVEAASEEEEPSTEDISTLAGLAEYFGVEHDDVLQALEVEGPDGSTIPISEALNAWRETSAGMDAYRTELDKQFSEQRQKVDETLAFHSQKLLRVAGELVKELEASYSDERLEELANEDPHAYAQAFRRKHELGALIGAALDAVEPVTKMTESHSQEQMQKLLKEEHAKLIAKKPEWQNRDTRIKAMQSGVDYLVQTGFTEQEIAGLNDHRLLLVIDDARRYRELQKGSDARQVDELRKRGLKPPSPGLAPQQRAGGTGRENKGEPKAIQAVRARLRKTGDPKDAARLMERFL